MALMLNLHLKRISRLLAETSKSVMHQPLKICSSTQAKLYGYNSMLFRSLPLVSGIQNLYSTLASAVNEKRSSEERCYEMSQFFAGVDLTNSASEVESVSLNPSAKSCNIRWEDGFQAEFHSIWLRHNCHCRACRHKTGQRLLDPASIQASIHIESLSNEGTSLNVSWSGSKGGHEGHIPHSFLRAHNYNDETMLARRHAVRCDRSISKIPRVKFEEICTTKTGLLEWLQQLNESGISLVTEVPTEDDQVAQVAELVGPVASTIYGTTFDVKATEDPINVAYSDVHIGLHMDLVYYESPPGLQLLHCLKFDECVEGGESIFLDAFTIADEFRVNFPDLFHTLTTVPATFQKVHYDRDYPVHIVNQKPHIRLNHFGEIVAVYWAPPFEGPLQVVGKDVEDYYRAYEVFAKSVNNSSYVLKHKLQPGELIVFNNLRMLHGRGQFKSNGGMRHLKGCYVNIDVFKSMTQVQNNLVGDGRLAKRVGNQCWL